jgi:hypothetical protein
MVSEGHGLLEVFCVFFLFCFALLLFRFYVYVQTLDHVDGLREMLSPKTRQHAGHHDHDNSSDGTPPSGSVMKTIPKGTGQMRQVVSLTGGGERDRERRR